jgi:hypothetical protein
MSAQTVQESIEETPERITTFRLHKTTGEILGNFSRTEAIEQYGHWLYSSGYSEGNGIVSLWILRNIK